MGDHATASAYGIQFDDGICSDCKHLNTDGTSCKAFPDGIPTEVLLGKFVHRKPYAGDHGVQFEAVKAAG